MSIDMYFALVIVDECAQCGFTTSKGDLLYDIKTIVLFTYMKCM